MIQWQRIDPEWHALAKEPLKAATQEDAAAADNAARVGTLWAGRPTARAAAPGPMMELTMSRAEPTEQGGERAHAEPRVAAAAEPHKRRAVAAGTAVGAAVGVGGNTAAGDEGTWTTVLSRRARRLAKAARPGGAAGGAARKAAAARAAATWRTVAAILDYVGDGE